MACDCKRAKNFEEKNGVREEENIIMKIYRFGVKIFFFVITFLLALIIVPYLVLYSVYSIFFGDNKITLPKFLRKYLE